MHHRRSDGLFRPAATSGHGGDSTRELYTKVSHFVRDIAGLEPAAVRPKLEYLTTEHLTGWAEKVCTQVVGLSDRDDDYVLARIALIARAAGVPLSCGHDGPNLRIFVTTAPKDLLKQLERQNALDMTGYRGLPHLVEQLIAKPQAVRVWYNVAGPNYLFALDLIQVVEVVDQTQLQGVSLDQLAAYVALVGLTEIKPVTQVVNAPTILNLFIGGPLAVPPRTHRVGSSVPEILIYDPNMAITRGVGGDRTKLRSG